MNLIELFQSSFEKRSDKPAIHIDQEVFSFGELDRRSDAAAVALRGRFGLTKGDRAAMYLGNSAALVIYYLACLKIGAIVVPVNVLLRHQELKQLLEDSQSKVLLTDGERLDGLAESVGQFPMPQHLIVAGGDNLQTAVEVIEFETLIELTSAAPVPEVSIRGDDPALMVYTSGTTGRSKGALLTHHNLVSNIVALLHCWQWTESDRFLLSLPLFHVHGLCNGLHGALASGCTTFLLERFNAEAVMALMHSQRTTLFFGVPTMYERLLEAAEQGQRIPLSMRLFVSGSAPLSPETFERFRQVFGHEILERYGMSETLMITSNLYAGPRGQGTVGKPLPGISVRIRKDDGSLAIEAADSGEIQVCGPNVMAQYWREPEKTSDSFEEGWFKTGDLGHWDDQGRLVICGRLKQLIISGGFNIYPQELINCLRAHPAIMDAVVIGVPDRIRGELVKAYVVTGEADLTAETVIDHCRAHLASYKVPRSVLFLATLPRNAMGKVQLDGLPDRDRL